MRVFISLMLLTIFSSASLLDFSYLNDAKEAYAKKEYKKAEELYAKVQNDEAKFNQADALYKQKKYKEAIDIYNSINNKDLEFKKLHNIGNAYANLKKIDEAIKSYEDALKIRDDEDTKFNLELLKRKKEEKKKKQKNRDKNNKDKNKNKDNKKDKERDNNSTKEQKKDKKDKDSKEDKKKEKQKAEPKSAEHNRTKPPISNMEERKWQKMLNKKGVTTLMLPLNNGEKRRDETNPW